MQVFSTAKATGHSSSCAPCRCPVRLRRQQYTHKTPSCLSAILEQAFTYKQNPWQLSNSARHFLPQSQASSKTVTASCLTQKSSTTAQMQHASHRALHMRSHANSSAAATSTADTEAEPDGTNVVPTLASSAAPAPPAELPASANHTTETSMMNSSPISPTSPMAPSPPQQPSQDDPRACCNALGPTINLPPLGPKRRPVPLAPGCVKGTFAFWHDEKRFKGSGETSLAQRTLLALGGLRVGGNHKADATTGPLGWQRRGEWDLLWSPASTARKAAEAGLAPGQVVSTVPGSAALTKKRELARTLVGAYGQDAFTLITPLTFEVPRQLPAWLAHINTVKQELQWGPSTEGPSVSIVPSPTLGVLEAGTGPMPFKGPPTANTPPASLSVSAAQQDPSMDPMWKESPGASSPTGASAQQHTAPTASWLPLSLVQRLQRAGVPPEQGGTPTSCSSSSSSSSSSANASSGGAGGLWILKTAQHLGKGMAIVPTQQAVKEVVMRKQVVMAAKTVAEKKAARSFVVAQQYLDKPLLINGRKFGIRLWVVVTSVDPLRLHLHSNGLVLFSSHAYACAAHTDLRAHLTNYAQNMHGDVWDLGRLSQHLGGEAFTRLLEQIQHITALTFAAAAPTMRAACAAARVPHGSVFELFGLDFLVDSDLNPWLLEVNSTPSTAVDHANPSVQQMIFDQKASMVADMFRLVRVPARFLHPHPPPSSSTMPGASRYARGSAASSTSPGSKYAGLGRGATRAAVAACLNSSALGAVQPVLAPVDTATCEGANQQPDLAAMCAREVQQMENLQQSILAAVPEALEDPRLLQVLLDTEVEAQAATSHGFTPLAPLIPDQEAVRALGWALASTCMDTAARLWYRTRPVLIASGSLPLVSSASSPARPSLYCEGDIS